MERTTRRDLLAGLASLPALFSSAFLGLLGSAKDGDGAPAPSQPSRRAGTPRITPPRESVTRRG
jgi:hypothetical protein